MLTQQPTERAGNAQTFRPVTSDLRRASMHSNSNPTTTIQPIVANGGQKIDVNHYTDGCVHIGVLYEGRGPIDPDYSVGFVLSPDAIRQLQSALAQIALDAMGGGR